uniref:Uncharacterized protein n=1 Tax=uncultured prokaryote TaxID=198431 RepID=A0A0H5Q3I6_9ZZZZ|nr:hypothetical protein [uncultured prokaryote]
MQWNWFSERHKRRIRHAGTLVSNNSYVIVAGDEIFLSNDLATARAEMLRICAIEREVSAFVTSEDDLRSGTAGQVIEKSSVTRIFFNGKN